MIRLWIFIAFFSLSLSIHLGADAHEENLLQSEQLENLRKSQLRKHNLYRSKHGCGPLALNNSLNDIAQQYSEHLAIQIHKLQHSEEAKSGQYGENLYWGSGSPTKTYADAEATNSWYSQQLLYNYGQFPPADGTGHFTAMIWKSVTSVGFGYYKIVENGGQAIYVVANYYPPPNVDSQGQYKFNVPSPNQNSIINNTPLMPLYQTGRSNNFRSNPTTLQPQNGRPLLMTESNKSSLKALTNESQVQSTLNETSGLNETSIQASFSETSIQILNDVPIELGLSSSNDTISSQEPQQNKIAQVQVQAQSSIDDSKQSSDNPPSNENDQPSKDVPAQQQSS